MIIAITGCIGSGKSYVSNLIHQKYGYDVFSSDIIAKKAYEDENIKVKLNDAFECIVNNKVDISIIKSKLNEETIKVLNAIIHPFVIGKINEIKDNYKEDIAFVEVPLLFESNMEHLFDKTIVISTSLKLRHKRIKNRNPLTYKDMLKLERYQLSNKEKVKRADYVIHSGEDDIKNINEIDKTMNLILKK